MTELAYCGNDCQACPRQAAGRDEARLHQVALLWHRVGWRDRVVTPGEIACEGCATANWCRYGLRECAMERGVDSCGRCPDYPCDNLSRAWESTGSWARVCGEVCSPEEYARLDRAFFQKKANLDRVNQAFRKEVSPE